MSDIDFALAPSHFTTSVTIAAIAGALAKAQGEIRNPAFDRVNPHFKNRYATLGAHIDAVRAPLSKHGIALIQSITAPSAGNIGVSTILAHSSGEWMRFDVAIPSAERMAIQVAGSNWTYLRRYALAAVLSIVGEEDTDGEEDRSAHARQAASPRSSTPQASRESSDERDDRMEQESREAPRVATLSPAEARGMMKVLESKKIPFEDLCAAMTRSGLNVPDDVTLWPKDWKNRVKGWLDQQASRG